MVPKKRWLLALSLALAAGCAVSPATGSPPAALRSIQAATALAPQLVPSLDQLRRLVPATLGAAEGRKILRVVPRDRIGIPAARKVKLLEYGHLGLGLGTLGFTPWHASLLAAPLTAIAGFYPFAFGGFDYYAPFLWNPLLLTYSAIAFTPWLTTAYPFYSYPFISTLGYSAGIGTLGCPGQIAPAIATTAIGCN
ncbi:MAG: hypothetical protein FJZ01_16030 [Candidatus Sericytochromatia bacterium]|nr:hypothetical protein [Candidatus Tanganyikabacteria bacterium]